MRAEPSRDVEIAQGYAVAFGRRLRELRIGNDRSKTDAKLWRILPPSSDIDIYEAGLLLLPLGPLDALLRYYRTHATAHLVAAARKTGTISPDAPLHRALWPSVVRYERMRRRLDGLTVQFDPRPSENGREMLDGSPAQVKHSLYVSAFGARLREARMNAGFSIPAVRDQLRSKGLYLTEYEDGRRLPPLDLLNDLAGFYGADARAWVYTAACDADEINPNEGEADRLWKSVTVYETARAWAGRYAQTAVST